MGEFFKGWRRKAGLVTLAMACVLIGTWPSSEPRVLTDATPDMVFKAIGSRVEVEGVAREAKEGDVIAAKHFSALLDFSAGQSLPRNGTPINVTGILRAKHQTFGYSYRIAEAQCRVSTKPQENPIRR